MERESFVIYNASAGAGKTFTLVKEYLKILMNYPQDDAFRYILSITFTNKAVHEMKKRIVDSLFAFSLDETPENAKALLHAVATEINKDEQFVKEKSKRILKKIMHNYTSFSVSTIDKFTQKIVRSFAHDLGLPINFEVSLESDAILQEAIDSLISKVGYDPLLTKIFIEFSLDKVKNDKSWDVNNELLNIGKLLTNEIHFEEVKSLENLSLEEFFDLKKYLSETIVQLKEDISQKAKDIFSYIENNGVKLESFNRKSYPNHISKFINNQKIEGKDLKYNEVSKITGSKSKGQADLIASIADYLAQQTDEIYQCQGTLWFYESFVQNIIPLSLLKLIYNEMKAIQEDKDLVAISEFNKIINNELKEQPVPYIYERMGERYRHFFIDEFQDTSLVQWENLVPLIDNALAGENESGKAGTLMLVGDPKQSIYRFRGGKVEQFIQLSGEYNPFLNSWKATKNLDTNFRSYSEIIESNNRFFSLISNHFTNEGYADLYLNQSAQKTNSKKGGFVSFTLIPKLEKSETKHKIYSEKVINIIKDCISQGYEYSDIAVLTRKNKQANFLATELTQADIPIISVESLIIKNSTLVQCIEVTLELIKNQQNITQRVWLLYYLSQFTGKETITHNLIINGFGKHLSEKEFEDYISKHYQLTFSFDYARTLSLFEMVTYIVNQLLFDYKNDAYIQYFMDLAFERSTLYYNDLQDFLHYWYSNNEKLSIPAMDQDNAVQMLSIHKSKGLEFPVVIIPYAEDKLEDKDNIWVPIENDDIVLKNAFVEQKSNMPFYSELINEVYQKNVQADLLDIVNIVYVAFTRATEQLYVIGYKGVITKENPTKPCVPYFIKSYLMEQNVYNEEQEEFTFGEKVKPSKKKSFDGKLGKIIESHPTTLGRNMVKIATKDGLMWSNEEAKIQAEAIVKGNIIHHILNDIHTKEHIDTALQKAIVDGMITVDQEQIIRPMLEKIVGHDDLKEFFNPQNRHITEMPLLKKGEPTLKPDRISLEGKKAYLLDYKTGGFHENYKVQIGKYREALEEMSYEVQKSLLVFIQDEIKIVEI